MANLENEVVIEETTSTEVVVPEDQSKLTGGEITGLVVAGGLVIVGAVTAVKAGINLGKKVYSKIKNSKAAKEAEELVDNTVETVKTTTKRSMRKKTKVEDDEE